MAAVIKNARRLDRRRDVEIFDLEAVADWRKIGSFVLRVEAEQEREDSGHHDEEIGGGGFGHDRRKSSARCLPLEPFAPVVDGELIPGAVGARPIGRDPARTEPQEPEFRVQEESSLTENKEDEDDDAEIFQVSCHQDPGEKFGRLLSRHDPGQN